MFRHLNPPIATSRKKMPHISFVFLLLVIGVYIAKKAIKKPKLQFFQVTAPSLIKKMTIFKTIFGAVFRTISLGALDLKCIRLEILTQALAL